MRLSFPPEEDVISFADAVELVANAGLPPVTLIEIGDEHRLAIHTH